MISITTHILDLSLGRPAGGVRVALERQGDGGAWQAVSGATTDADGRVRGFEGASPIRPGVFRLKFETGAYFAARGAACFHPRVEIVFTIEAEGHYHVPLLLSPFGYTTYRGS